MKTSVITQGEHLVSADAGVTISTLLGSCVACCLWDPLAMLGGMNHMLIATRHAGGELCDRAGVHAMELLINDLLKGGAQRSRLQAKVFGGARMFHSLSDIGAANAAFTLRFLARENIPCVAQSLGGTYARQLTFHPQSGVARQKTRRDPKTLDPVVLSSIPLRGNGIEML